MLCQPPNKNINFLWDMIPPKLCDCIYLNYQLKLARLWDLSHEKWKFLAAPLIMILINVKFLWRLCNVDQCVFVWFVITMISGWKHGVTQSVLGANDVLTMVILTGLWHWWRNQMGTKHQHSLLSHPVTTNHPLMIKCHLISESSVWRRIIEMKGWKLEILCSL